MNKQKILVQFGKRLQVKRKEAKLTQAQLAEKIGFSTNFIGMIERGERNTNYSNIFNIVYALGLTMEKFFKGM